MTMAMTMTMTMTLTMISKIMMTSTSMTMTLTMTSTIMMTSMTLMLKMLATMLTEAMLRVIVKQHGYDMMDQKYHYAMIVRKLPQDWFVLLSQRT